MTFYDHVTEYDGDKTECAEYFCKNRADYVLKGENEPLCYLHAVYAVNEKRREAADALDNEARVRY